MKKNLLYILAGAVVILLILFFFVPSKKERKFIDKVTLAAKDKIPYGSNVAYTLLQNIFPSSKTKINRLEPGMWKALDKDTGNQVLLIVTKNFDPTEYELDKIIAFAQKGNDVLISSIVFNELSSKAFKITQRTDSYSYENTSKQEIRGSLFSDSFHVTLDSNIFVAPLKFYCAGKSYDNYFYKYDNYFAYPLGYSKENDPNMLAIKSMKGTIYLHSAPLTFSNFFLLYNDNHKYFESIISLFHKNPTAVVWDEYFLYPRSYDSDGKGVLSVILKYPAFKWAFWLALILLFIFVFTEAKRKQRVMEDYKQPVNEHLEFITTVGKLYFEKGDHANLALKMTQFFLEYLRSKYKINTAVINSDMENFVKTLAMKTGIEHSEAITLAQYVQKSQSGIISSNELITYYTNLETFYKKA